MTWMSTKMQTSKKLIKTSTKINLFESNSNTQMSLKNNSMTKQHQPQQPPKQPKVAKPRPNPCPDMNNLTDEQRLRMKRQVIKREYNRMKTIAESIDRKNKLIKLLMREKKSLDLQYQTALDIFLLNASQIDFNF